MCCDQELPSGFEEVGKGKWGRERVAPQSVKYVCERVMGGMTQQRGGGWCGWGGLEPGFPLVWVVGCGGAG